MIMLQIVLNAIIWIIKLIRRWFLGDIANAFANKDFDLIEKLIRLGADPNFTTDNETLLHIASANGNLRLLRTLLLYGANIKAKNKHNQSVFEVAANGEVLQILKIYLISLAKSTTIQKPISQILQKEIQPIALKENLGKLLHDAILKDDKIQVKDLLNQGVNIESLNIKGQTPLYAALSNNRLEIAGILLKEGSLIQELDAQKNLAIHLAAARGDVEQVKILTDKDPIAVNKQDADGKTPLHYVASTNNVEVAQILCDKGADVNARNHKENTPLHENAAIPHDNKEMTRFLIYKGADVLAKNIEGQVPLDIAKLVKIGAAIKHFENIVERKVENIEHKAEHIKKEVKQTIKKVERTIEHKPPSSPRR